MCPIVQSDLIYQSTVGTLYNIIEKCPSCIPVLIEILADFSTNSNSISIEFCRFFNFVISSFSVSDFDHRIGLPAQIVAIKMISKIRTRNIEHVALGIYLSAMLIESGTV